jgi:HK97 family phage major capsid protein
MSLFTSKELGRFSTTKFLAEIANQPVPGVPEATLLTGLEREVSDTLASHVKKITGTTTTGALLPIACLKAFNVTTATAGGFLVGEDFLGGIVPALRSASVVLDLGSQLWENLRSDLGLPRESTTQTAQSLSETGELSAPPDSIYAKTVLTPRRAACMMILSQQLLSQSSAGIELFCRSSILKSLATAIDKAALSGAGGVEPTGILNFPGTSTSVTFGGTASRSKLVSMQQSLVDADAGNTPSASLAWSHVYHKEGSRFYGKTKKGKYVSEADAIKEGDRAAAKGH